MLLEKVQQLADSFLTDTISYRRHLHQHPELSFQEYNTSRYICQKLDEYGIAYQTGIGKTGVIGLIYGKNPQKRIVALRADMDALPIHETNACDYASIHPGVMHACGHDVHTASLLGAARILQALRDEWEGTIKLIFQPAEEVTPSGAMALIAEGALDNPRPASIFGQHADPMLPVGKIGLRSGLAMASADEIYLTIQGKGGHGARPHQCIDPVVVASHLVVALQQLVSRNANPFTPTVLTFGKIFSDGGATNIIPERVHLWGTLRTFDEEWRDTAHSKIRQLSELLGESMGAKVEVNLEKGIPFLHNDERLTAQVRGLAEAFLGAENVLEIPPRMGAEDFAFYSHHLPACFYRLGALNPNGTDLHTPTFDIDENALRVGAGLLAWIGCGAM